MRRRVQPNAWSGFTIVETMIVLAVTGVMLLSVIALISGKQNKTEFNQGINQAVSQLQQQAHDVAIGYYPDITNMSCTSINQLNFSITQAVHGSNQGCVYLGKVLQFGVNAGGSANERYNAYALAGCQFANCISVAEPSTSLAEAKPTVIYPTPAHSGFPAVAESQDLQNGIQMVKVCYYVDSTELPYPNCPHQTTAFAILQSQASLSQGGNACNGICSGSQQFGLYGIAQTPPNNISPASMSTLVDSSSNTIVAAVRVSVCLKSGTTNQSGLITIDGEGGSVSLQVKNGGTCT